MVILWRSKKFQSILSTTGTQSHITLLRARLVSDILSLFNPPNRRTRFIKFRSIQRQYLFHRHFESGSCHVLCLTTKSTDTYHDIKFWHSTSTFSLYYGTSSCTCTSTRSARRLFYCRKSTAVNTPNLRSFRKWAIRIHYFFDTCCDNGILSSPGGTVQYCTV